jgi:hypothetical protein
VKLFLDENISPLHVTELRADGYDASGVELKFSTAR